MSKTTIEVPSPGLGWRFRLLVGLAIGAAGLWWAGYGVNWLQVGQSFNLISPLWIAAAVGCVVGVALSKTARWGALYRSTHYYPAFGRLFAVLMAAQAINLVIPVRVGEVVRIGLMKRAGMPATITLLTIVVEKALDLFTTGLLATTLVVLAAAPVWMRQPAREVMVLGVALLMGLILFWRLRHGIERFFVNVLSASKFITGRWRHIDRWRYTLCGAVHTLFGGLDALTDWRSTLPVLWWTLVIWLLSLLTMMFLFYGFNLHLPLSAAVILMLAVGASNIVPSPPALIGVMHGIAVVVLSRYGVDHAVALGFGIVLNVVTVLPLVLLGLGAFLIYMMPILQLLHPQKPGKMMANNV